MPFMITSQRAIVACTARAGTGTSQGPDRSDHRGTISSFIVETAADAERLFRELDASVSEIYVDVERKKPFDLMAIAHQTLSHARIWPYKPNDTTVDAADATVLAHHGPDLAGLQCGVYGTGNLGFKIALRLAERNAHVFVAGRNLHKVDQIVSTLNMILPSSAPYPVDRWTEQPLDALVSAVTAHGIVGPDQARRMRNGSLAIDAGINNFSACFMAAAHDVGCEVVRLDVRAATPNLQCRANFFDTVAGHGTIGGISVVAGGFIGRVGEIVVDSKHDPSRVVGVADGLGGLLDEQVWTAEQAKEVRLLHDILDARQTSH